MVMAECKGAVFCKHWGHHLRTVLHERPVSGIDCHQDGETGHPIVGGLLCL